MNPRATVLRVVVIASLVAPTITAGPMLANAVSGSPFTPAVVSVDGIIFRVPPPGHGVFATALEASGGERSASVRTLPDGTILVHRASVDAGGAVATPIDECSDRHYTLNGSRWRRAMAWSFRGRSTPAGVGRRSVAKALRRAGTNIVTGRNTCRMPDRLTATQRYLGRTAAQPNISSASACLKPDGRSVVGFGTIDSSELGFTCWWTIGDRTVEADMMLNSVNYGWTTNPGAACQGRWSVEAVATHEFGHAFGLGHVSPVLDANQTMSPVITPCQNAQATLGRGDVLGLRAVY